MKNNFILKMIADKSPHLKWINENTHLLVRHGSHAYNTNIESSDEDFKGICTPSKEYFLGYINNFEQAELKDPDTVIYDLRKFFHLAADCNPNIIEVLHTDSSDHILVDSIGESILDNKYAFLSKKVKHTFSGYAMAQLKRIKLHKKWIMNPIKEPPTRESMGLPEYTLIPQDQLVAAQAEINKELDRFQFNFLENLEESSKIEIRTVMSEMLAELKITSEQHWMSAARKIGLNDNFIELMQKERQYTGAKREFDQYQNWKSNRNPKRFELEEKFGYDCYLDDTEFLTATGWKKYDDIGNGEPIATLNKISGKIEYQIPYERVSKNYSGNIIFIETQHSNCAVTPNHRMWVSEISRKENNNFSTIYDKNTANWQIKKAEDLIRDHKSWYHTRISASPNEIEYNISDNELKLIGAYISEGCIGKRLVNGKASAIRLSQKNDGKMLPLLEEIANHFKMNRYESIHKKDNGSECLEYVYTLADVALATNLEKFGTSSNDKCLPPWADQLSQRQVKILLNALLLGDGSFRKYSSIYHTSSKKLADDIQSLCICNGITSSIWGPYKNRDDSLMFQVYIGKEQETIVTRFNTTSNHCKIEEVFNRKIVCFSVNNEILITRRNGKIAIQGNTKHAYHLVRLMRMCKEILTTGKVIVKRPDREELLAIRNGAWTYDELMDFSLKQEEEINKLYAVSNILPNSPNRKYLDKLCVELVEKSLSKYSWFNIKKIFNKLFKE